MEATYSIFRYIYQLIYSISSTAASFEWNLDIIRALQQFQAVMYTALQLTSYSLMNAILLELCKAKKMLQKVIRRDNVTCIYGFRVKLCFLCLTCYWIATGSMQRQNTWPWDIKKPCGLGFSLWTGYYLIYWNNTACTAAFHYKKEVVYLRLGLNRSRIQQQTTWTLVQTPAVSVPSLSPSQFITIASQEAPCYQLMKDKE